MTYRLAKFLIESGVSVVPLARKTPIIKWKRLQNERLTPEELYLYFARQYSRVAFVTGNISGFVVVDADDAEAVKFVKNYCPFSPMQRQTKRGQHFYFKHPGTTVPNAAKINGLNLDIRGDGGYVVVDQSLTNFSRDLPEFKMEWLNHG